MYSQPNHSVKENEAKHKIKIRSYFLVLLLSSFFASFLNAQSLIPIYTGDHFEIPFVNSKGKELFSLPAGHALSTSNDYSYKIVSSAGYRKIHFDKENAVVQRPDRSIYLINGKGKIVKEFGKKYTKMSRLVEGYYLAWEKIPERPNATMLLFLDKNGNIAFGNQKFWNTKTFSEGLTPVQSVENGKWRYINVKGETIINVEKIDTNHILVVGKFSNGLAEIQAKKPDKKWDSNLYYINRKGEIVLDVYQHFPDRYLIYKYIIAGGHIVVGFKKKEGYSENIFVFDKNGKKLFGVEKGEKFRYLENGEFIYNFNTHDDSGKYVETKIMLVNKEGEQRDVTNSLDTKVLNYLYSHTLPRPYVGSLGSKSKDKSLSPLSPIEEVFKDKPYSQIIGYDKELILLQNIKTSKFYLANIKTSEIIWTPNKSNRLYTSLEEALTYKKRVRHYVLSDEEDFKNGFFKLKNITNLELEWIKSGKIPAEIAKLQQLKNLKIRYSQNLESFPSEIIKLKKLEYLDIDDCPKYKEGLEFIIENLPNLKEVKLNNVELKKGFIQKMKHKKPNLKITSATTIEWEEEVIEEW